MQRKQIEKKKETNPDYNKGEGEKTGGEEKGGRK